MFSFLLSLLTFSANSTSFSYRLHAAEEACFYAYTTNPNTKMSFYFSVQSGGNFDIDYTVHGPSSTLLFEGQKERSGDFIYTAVNSGEYAFCFSNVMSTFADKLFDFEIVVEGESAEHPFFKEPKKGEEETPMEQSLTKISGSLWNYKRHQNYFKTREVRNMETVTNTEGRIFYFALLVAAMIVTVGVLQVAVVQSFFKNTNRRGI